MWIRLPRSRRPQPWDEIQDPVIAVGKNFVRTSVGRIAVGARIPKGLDGQWLGKRFQTGNVYSCTAEKKGFCLSDMKLGGRTTYLKPTWSKLMKPVDLEEPTLL